MTNIAGLEEIRTCCGALWVDVTFHEAAAWEDATYLSVGFEFGCVLLAIICDAVS